MKQNQQRYFEFVQKLTNSINFLSNFRIKSTYFSRSTLKLTLARLIAFVLSSNRNSAQVAINDFFKELGEETLTKQSLFEAREKISYKAFSFLCDEIVNKFYIEEDFKKWNGFRVMAVDGSVFELPQTAISSFGGQKTGEDVIAQGRAVAFTDVLNKMLVGACLSPISIGEREIACKMIDDFDIKSTDLFLFDRGFYSKQMCINFSRNGAKFLFRVKNHCQKAIHNANLADQIISIDGDFPVRVVNFTLINGQTEKLVTNILDQNVTVSDFGDLYALRWGVEVNFLMLKQRLQIEDFSSGKKELILQDFFASILVYNLTNIVCLGQDEARNAATETDNKSLEYASNRNIALHEIRQLMISAIVTQNKIRSNYLFARAQKLIYKFSQPVRPGRSYPRIVKHPSKRFPMNNKSNR